MAPLICTSRFLLCMMVLLHLYLIHLYHNWLDRSPGNVRSVYSFQYWVQSDRQLWQMHWPCTPCWRQEGGPDPAACCAGPGWGACLRHWWPSSPSSWPSTTPHPCPCTYPGWTPVEWSWWGPQRRRSGSNTGTSSLLLTSPGKEEASPCWGRCNCWMKRWQQRCWGRELLNCRCIH